MAQALVIVGLTVMAVTAMAGAQDPLPGESPTPVPTASPEPTPEPTPEATPEPSPEPTPEATPEPSPEPTPAPAAAAAPAAPTPEPVAATRQAQPEPVTFCHATGAASAPYVTITLPAGALLGHDAHPDDIIPAPAGGCPATPQAPVATPVPTVAPEPERDEVTICHATGDRGTPFIELTVSRRGVAAHRGHERDVIPKPATGCPDAAVAPERPAPAPATPKPAAPKPEPRGEVLDDSRSGSAPAPRPAAPRDPAPTAPVAPVARAQGAELAYTGTDAWLLGVLGFGMALAGCGLFLVTAEPPRPR